MGSKKITKQELCLKICNFFNKVLSFLGRTILKIRSLLELLLNWARNYYWYNFIWFLFIIVSASTIFGTLELYSELRMHSFLIRFIYLNLTFTDKFLIFGTIFIILVGVLWFRLPNTFRIQKLRNQPSVILYVYFSLCFAPLFSYLISQILILNYVIPYTATHLTDNFTNLHIFRNINFTVSIDLLFRFKVVFYGTLIYLLLPRIGLSHNKLRFAAEAVGSEDDELDFKATAEGIANSINDLQGGVSVVAIYGRMGEGKSSLARMVIESLDIDKNLYTYLSLTETNEAKDLSKLFSERWLETINSRYPKFDHVNSQVIMQSILRETGHSWLSQIIAAASYLNRGLLKTVLKIQDKYYKSINKYVSDEVSKIFGNIPKYTENGWVIMVDELERSRFDEVYRLIEIIERFKMEGRIGLPIKIVFLLCIARDDLELLLGKFDNSSVTANLIKDFFFTNPRNITESYHVPPIPPDVKANYVAKGVYHLVKEENINVGF